MRANPLALPDVLLLEPTVFSDERGCFFESFNRRSFERATGLWPEFVQDNRSVSLRGVLRGLHFQRQHPQDKLVTVLAGEVFDVAVDLRRSSATFGKWVGETLSAANRRQMWVPKGFGHGFLVLSESAEVLYKTTDYYVPDDQHAVAWNDPHLKIEWPVPAELAEPLMAPRDREAPALHAASLFE